MRSAAAVLPFLLAAAPVSARADRRYYGETYDAAVASPGDLELELWETFHQAPPAGVADLWRTQIELETGLLRRWDVALYNVLRSESGQGTRYEALKLETRYGLADRGAWPVDVVLYLEVMKEFLEDRAWVLEEKVIAARDLGPLNLSLNLAAEQEWIVGGNETELGGALGASLELVPALRLGAEVFGGRTRVAAAGVAAFQNKAWAGPAVSVAALEGWLLLAAGFGLTDQSEKVRARAILGWEF
ncbi:MAG TPA: hypothetical protein VFR85_12230 [Anaeromyxobacteraceae bacterium]|nr:hypothetical protein [Anaeromyxobacteraceae bacterium]